MAEFYLQSAHFGKQFRAASDFFLLMRRAWFRRAIQEYEVEHKR
jgi:hypothetical protein